MKFGVLGSNNIYVRETTTGFSDFFCIDAIILNKNEEKCNIFLDNRINLRYTNSRSVLSLLKLPFTIKMTSRFVDGFIVHYMNLYFALLIASGIVIDKPIAYLCYGGDVHKSKIRNWFVKKALEKVDLIFVEIPSQKDYLHNFFGVPYDKLESSKIVFPVNPSFKKYSDLQKEVLREKWNLFKKNVIFSPRTVDEHYNHQILIEAVGHLDDSLKRDIQIVITGFNGGENKDYLNRLIEIGEENNVCVVNLNRFLTPEEMAEIYNVSLINVNIPKHDQLGRSIMEGCLCGCIPLLSIKVPAYHDLFKNEENCVFVEPEPEAIAAKIEWILKNQDKMKENFYSKNTNIFLKYQNTKQVYYDLTSRIGEIVR